MDLFCTRPGCPRPLNSYSDLDSLATLKTVQQKFCTTCGMPLILVGRYLIIKPLARGGFGATFIAQDRYTPGLRRCVVKQLQPSLGLDANQLETAKQLFIREGEVLEDLGRHPQIPDLLAFFELPVKGFGSQAAQEFFFLVQEFVDGQTLEEELHDQGPFSEAKGREVLTSMLPVLEFVHEAGSIHRDIKPANIMRRKDGRLYLLDFGAVKQVTRAAANPARGLTGIYTPFFAPTEQTHGNAVFPSTDLYSLAVTCICLLTGKPPEELFDPHNNCWAWRPHTQVSDHLGSVLDRMLESAPTRRFQTAGEALAALQTPIPSPQPPASQPLTPQPPASKRLSKRRSTNLQKPAPTPAPPPPVPAPPAQSPATSAGFSLTRLLVSAAFTGFEAGLLWRLIVGLGSGVLGGLSGGLVAWGLVVALLIIGQTLRWIEKTERLVLLSITVAAALVLARAVAVPTLALAVFASLAAVALATLFRLVYTLLSNLIK
ncbi:serine/threonine-protein kinase [Leptolyngbya sp. FACHB-261]|uniref:serine/threonine-protein kinase n=1 Tax=Leptolyngbya sp. FACHB-261 TaxID=2692806 RepID=UPI001685EF17|nr:serine/threonine-protein kinase [Leptolyngbya sp. FACHB-261]MBD2102192.1 serine/threonine protein kinase [Leptolyngbya sp. FACHB-261]